MYQIDCVIIDCVGIYFRSCGGRFVKGKLQKYFVLKSRECDRTNEPFVVVESVVYDSLVSLLNR